MLFSLVDSEVFLALLQEMDRKYQVPHGKGVSQEISNIYNHLQETIQSLLSKAVIISSVDIWSKLGMTASFLGVTAHLIQINVRRFPSPHTGVRIAELLLRIVAEWDIPCNK